MGRWEHHLLEILITQNKKKREKMKRKNKICFPFLSEKKIRAFARIKKSLLLFFSMFFCGLKKWNRLFLIFDLHVSQKLFLLFSIFLSIFRLTRTSQRLCSPKKKRVFFPFTEKGAENLGSNSS